MENVIVASWSPMQRSWLMTGGATTIQNHGKWSVAADSPTVVSGDMNSQGFPCSHKTNCASSQGGRGGMFFGFQHEQLHSSLLKIVSVICDCSSATKASYRMCGYGCQRFAPAAGSNDVSFIPQTNAYSQDSSAWEDSGKGWTTAG